MTYMEQVKQAELIEKLNNAFEQVGEASKQMSKGLKNHTECVSFIGNAEVEISPYDEPEKRVIGGKIVNVTYHKIDWKKNFAAKR